MEFLAYFSGVFEPVAFTLLILGTVGGLILGATPGLSPTMAVALLIPFTFHLTPVQGVATFYYWFVRRYPIDAESDSAGMAALNKLGRGR